MSGDKGIRTLDPLLARQVLSQLSYAPRIPSQAFAYDFWNIQFIYLPSRQVGLSGLEPPTSRLSGVRSNQLSYKPIDSGAHLLSHAVSSIVPSAALVLTIVFGMYNGCFPKAHRHQKFLGPLRPEQ